MSDEAPQLSVQTEMPFAIVQGKAVVEPPQDLYIPPDALEIILEVFEGPLDLLLYLIRKQNLDILDIPITRITEQYMEYIRLLEEMRFELAAEYLLMAAMLAEIKSRMLLPRHPELDEQDEEDPRAELVRRLQEYERYRKAAEDLGNFPRPDRDFCLVTLAQTEDYKSTVPPQVDLNELLYAFQDVLRREDLSKTHQVEMEQLSVHERMTIILNNLHDTDFVPFTQFFTAEEGRLGAVVTFLAIMELVKEQVLELIQNKPLEPIYVRPCQ
ncbi:MAG: segregation and condensation protein A [bacterium]